jgi:glycosyltransferase involved in cell wall biosynthesis
MKPLRFCMVTTFYPPYHFGGDAVFVRALSQALVAEGHTVDVVHCEDAYRLRGDSPIADEPPDKIVVHRLHSRFGALSPLITQQTGKPGLKRAALRRILDQPFDVIHYHNISLIGGPDVLTMGTAPVKLYTTHEHWLVCPMHVLWKNRQKACDKPQCLRCCLRSGTPPQLWRYTGMIHRCLRHIDLLLTPSAFTAQRHREGGITCPIQVLPTFATIGAPAASDSPLSGRAHFVFAGRLTHSKGVLDLAAQFRTLPQYDLTIAGEGELLETLRRSFGDCANIRLLGAVSAEQVVRLFQQATAMILPCVGPEVFPLVVLEALACGTPVIVREAGGSAEAVQATGGGVVYRTSNELRQAVQRIADDPAWRDSLASNAILGYQQRYTVSTHLTEYFRIIQAIQTSKHAGDAPGAL